MDSTEDVMTSLQRRMTGTEARLDGVLLECAVEAVYVPADLLCR